MGAWGYNADENDDAQDILRDGIKGIKKAYKKKLGTGEFAQDERFGRVGAVYALVRKSGLRDRSLIRKVLEDIRELQRDDDFMRNWKNAASFRKALRRNTEVLKKALG